VLEPAACYASLVVSTIDRLSDLAPERVRPLRRVEYERLVAEGLFGDERIELLGGVIVEMSPQDPRHAFAIERLTAVLGPLVVGRARLRVQLPFAASSDSLPEPDVALVPVGDYSDAHPDRALLVIEVANTSLRKDRLLKGEIYARAGVPEYWIVNLVDRRIEVYTGPSEGAYAKVSSASPGDALSIAALGNVTLPVSDVLG
jgi:Uma2 family endonuclease